MAGVPTTYSNIPDGPSDGSEFSGTNPKISDNLKGIDEPGPWFMEMSKKWERAQALMGGTDSMRDAGITFMPQYEAEDDYSFNNRLERAVLTNFYKAMLENMVGHVFQKPLTVQSKLDPNLITNIDRQGNSLNRFAREAFKMMMQYGYVHIFCNYPRVNKEGMTLAKERELNIRPYWQIINPTKMIDVYIDAQDGKEDILMARWREERVEVNGFRVNVYDRIRVLEPGEVRVYEKDPDKKEWFLVEDESGPFDLDYVPLRTIYAHQSGPLVSEPPLDGVAHLNIEHWQSSSDQRNILTLSRFAMLAQSGGNEPANLESGPRTHLYMADAQGKFYFVEPEGNGIQSGERDMQRIINDAEMIGFNLMIKRKGNETATGRTIDATKVTSPLQDMALALEDGLNDCLRMTGDWLNRTANDAGMVKVNEDYGFMPDEQARLEALHKARDKYQITQKTYLEGLKQMGIFSAEMDIEKEIAETENEDPMMGMGTSPFISSSGEEDDGGEEDKQAAAG